MDILVQSRSITPTRLRYHFYPPLTLTLSPSSLLTTRPDRQEYYANTGALKKAAENNGREGRKVSVSVIEVGR